MFKNEMKAKRCKTGDGDAKKNEKGNIPERPELVVQRLSSEVSGKAEKYTRVGPRKFVQYDEEELSIVGIKAPASVRNISRPHWNTKDSSVMFWPVSRGHLVTQ